MQSLQVLFGEVQVWQRRERLPAITRSSGILHSSSGNRSSTASGLQSRIPCGGVVLWDVAYVLSVAAHDSSNVPSSLGQGDLARFAAPQKRRCG